MTASDDETGHVLFRIMRRNGRLLHTFERYADTDWTLVTPPSKKLRRRYETGKVKFVQSPPPDDLPPGVDWTYYTTSGGDDLRTADVVQDGKYRLNDGIPPIRQEKLHRIFDGLVARGEHSIDSDGLIREITAG